MRSALLAATLVAAAITSGSVCSAAPEASGVALDIGRGGSAGDACFEATRPSLDLGQLAVCVLKAQSANLAAAGATPDAFDAGLFFKTWCSAYLVGGSSPLGEAVQEDMWRRYLKARHAAGVSDAEVVAALHMTAAAAALAKTAADQWGD